MCGFVAVLSAKPLPPGALERMRDRVAHRGPDGAGDWTTPAGRGWQLGLGFRRLAILDLSDAASQPMFSGDGSIALVFNGEIYNYVELRKELESAGSQFRTHGDTEVLLRAYERWGTDCLTRLNGMFAFAMWDGRKQRLFVARDRFGEKPLFLTELPGGGFAFASEMKALFAHPDVRVAPDEDTVARYVDGTYWEEGEQTLFRGVARLPGAHALIVEPGSRPHVWRYWTPEYAPPDAPYDERVATERFGELLEQSIRMRLRSDVPVGTSLSGGLDSSAIVGLLARMRVSESDFSQNTFSGRFPDDPTLSEGPQIDLVARATGVNAHASVPDPVRLIDESRALHWHQEEPFLSASIYVQWCVMRLARDNETTVLLDGQGADELLAGYQFYFRSFQLDLLDRHRYLQLARETRLFNGRLRRASRSFENGGRRFNPDIAASPAELARAWRRRPDPFHGPFDVGVPEPRRGWRLRRVLAEALLYNSLPQLLRYADRNAMAFSRETRLPFLDYRLVDWVLTLPDRALIRDGWQKIILRNALGGVIPPEIQWRVDKVGYAAPLDVWARGPLRDWMFDRVFGGPVVDVPGYDRAALSHLWASHQAGNGEHSWALWRWLSLNEWLGLIEDGVWKDDSSLPSSAPLRTFA